MLSSDVGRQSMRELVDDREAFQEKDMIDVIDLG